MPVRVGRAAVLPGSLCAGRDLEHQRPKPGPPGGHQVPGRFRARTTCAVRGRMAARRRTSGRPGDAGSDLDVAPDQHRVGTLVGEHRRAQRDPCRSEAAGRPTSVAPPGGGGQVDLAGDRAAEREAGPVEDEHLTGPEFGLGPAADPHDGRVGGLGPPHEQHLHWEVFHVVSPTGRPANRSGSDLLFRLRFAPVVGVDHFEYCAFRAEARLGTRRLACGL
jgi:hypothetical protein